MDSNFCVKPSLDSTRATKFRKYGFSIIIIIKRVTFESGFNDIFSADKAEENDACLIY